MMAWQQRKAAHFHAVAVHAKNSSSVAWAIPMPEFSVMAHDTRALGKCSNSGGCRPHQ